MYFHENRQIFMSYIWHVRNNYISNSISAEISATYVRNIYLKTSANKLQLVNKVTVIHLCELFNLKIR